MAEFAAENDWESNSKLDFVSIGTHKLFVSVSGLPRKPGDPIVVIIPGLGGGTSSWAAVVREVSSFGRVMLYDRTGTGKSEKAPSASPRTGAAIGEELSTLLEAIHIEPPYVLLTQSYGGVLAREFLAQRPKDIVGLCLVDCNTERTYLERPIPEEFFEAIMKDIDYYAVTGLNTRHKFTTEEWEALLCANKADTGEAMGAEWQEYKSSSDTLAAHKQFEAQIMGDHPVSIIKGNTVRDLRLLTAKAIEKGNGAKEMQDAMLRILETMDEIEERHQLEQLKLSSCHRFVYAREGGHNVQFTEPDLIADEVRWILRTYGLSR